MPTLNVTDHELEVIISALSAESRVWLETASKKLKEGESIRIGLDFANEATELRNKLKELDSEH